MGIESMPARLAIAPMRFFVETLAETLADARVSFAVYAVGRSQIARTQNLWFIPDFRESLP
jgi:hypothetical protein